MTNTMTAAHLTTSAAESIIRALVTASTDAAVVLANARRISATIDGRVGAAIDKLGMDAAVAIYAATHQALAKRSARWAKKAA